MLWGSWCSFNAVKPPSIAFVSKALGPKNLGLSIDEKEFLAILFAVEKWRSYLLHAPFIIRTDQRSLKFLVDQKISTPVQHKYMTKILGLDYTIEYKQGPENKVADALSRRDIVDDSAEYYAISGAQPLWMQELLSSYEGDGDAEEAILLHTAAPYDVSYFSVQGGVVRYKGKLYIGRGNDFRSKVIKAMHESVDGGHSGVLATYHKVKNVFKWHGLKAAIQKVVGECIVCQRCKSEHVKSPGLLQPLPVPTQVWQHITMDFIEKLPKSDGMDTIMVVVVRFTKFAHFVPMLHPFTALQVAETFLNSICKFMECLLA